VGGYALRGGREGYQRLQVLSRVHRVDTVDLLARAGLRPGMRCLDLGCGGGEVTFELAALAGPGGSAIGVDRDEMNLALAREAAQQRRVANVEFRAADVNDWDEPDAYDFVYSRFLLQHLSQPRSLLLRMWHAVRPEGAIAVEDTDFDGMFCEPGNDALDFHRRMYPSAVERNGGDARIGRRLYRYFLEAGIPEPGLRLVQHADAAGEAKTMALLTLQSIEESIVSAGLASSGQVAAAIEELAAFTADPETIIGGPRIFQLWAQRPMDLPAPGRN
jgi:ubiquinone/menaquinone biosynthesis C-methylase UbiE